MPSQWLLPTESAPTSRLHSLRYDGVSPSVLSFPCFGHGCYVGGISFHLDFVALIVLGKAVRGKQMRAIKTVQSCDRRGPSSSGPQFGLACWQAFWAERTSSSELAMMDVRHQDIAAE